MGGDWGWWGGAITRTTTHLRHKVVDLDLVHSEASGVGQRPRTDPYERRDLSTSADPKHVAALERLLVRWRFWKEQTVAPRYPDSDPRSYPNRFGGVYNGSWSPWL